MRRILMAASLLVPLATSAFADDDTPNMKGVGVTDCQDVVETLKAHPGGAGYVYSEWVNGLMSGANILMISQKRAGRDLRSSTQDSVISGVIEFCKTHPDDNLGDAAVHIWLSQPAAGS